MREDDYLQMWHLEQEHEESEDVVDFDSEEDLQILYSEYVADQGTLDYESELDDEENEEDFPSPTQ